MVLTEREVCEKKQLVTKTAWQMWWNKKNSIVEQKYKVANNEKYKYLDFEIKYNTWVNLLSYIPPLSACRHTPLLPPFVCLRNGKISLYNALNLIVTPSDEWPWPDGCSKNSPSVWVTQTGAVAWLQLSHTQTKWIRHIITCNLEEGSDADSLLLGIFQS